MAMTASGVKFGKCQTEILRVFDDDAARLETDVLAVEEPLEIRLGFIENKKITHKAVSITMRTPGNDFELAAGFLFTENILTSPEQISSIKYCGKFPNNQNTVRIDLRESETVNLKKLERHFYTTSSCGVCGKTSIEALENGAKPLSNENTAPVSAKVIRSLPEKLRARQKIFEQTGGLHAAALFDFDGNFLDLREDVGRHNAVDKLLGAKFLAGELPIANKILFLSGRASFELIQKAVTARIPVVCAVGAPSSLAVEAAGKFNITLLGFVRENKFNVYNNFGAIQNPKSEILNRYETSAS